MPPAPTVPSRVTPGLGGEAVRAGRFRGSDLSRGLGCRSSGVLPALARLPVSPLAPRQGRSPGGSPLGSSGTGVPDPAVPLILRRSIGSAFRQVCLWPKPLACLAVHGLASWACRFRSSRAEARSCPKVRGRSPVSAGGSAPTCVPLSAGQESGPKSVVPSVLVRYPKVPEPGHLTMPAAFASAKGQARSIRLAAASSAARAFAPWPHCLVGQEALFAGAVAGKAFDRCRSIVSATSESCHENRVAPSGF